MCGTYGNVKITTKGTNFFMDCKPLMNTFPFKSNEDFHSFYWLNASDSLNTHSHQKIRWRTDLLILRFHRSNISSNVDILEMQSKNCEKLLQFVRVFRVELRTFFQSALLKVTVSYGCVARWNNNISTSKYRK